MREEGKVGKEGVEEKGGTFLIGHFNGACHLNHLQKTYQIPTTPPQGVPRVYGLLSDPREYLDSIRATLQCLLYVLPNHATG